MIDYPLAKELKDAGFPQGGPPSRFLWLPTDNPHVMENGVYCPTLSELIEACGHGFSHIQHVADFEWEAVGHKKEGELLHRGWGHNHDEAVARLWLALEKVKPRH